MEVRRLSASSRAGSPRPELSSYDQTHLKKWRRMIGVTTSDFQVTLLPQRPIPMFRSHQPRQSTVPLLFLSSAVVSTQVGPRAPLLCQAPVLCMERHTEPRKDVRDAERGAHTHTHTHTRTHAQLCTAARAAPADSHLPWIVSACNPSYQRHTNMQRMPAQKLVCHRGAPHPNTDCSSANTAG